MNAESVAGSIHIEDRRAMDVIGSPVHAGVFELIRRFRGGASIDELAEVSGLAERSLRESIDALESIGLVRPIRARKSSSRRFAARCRRITIVADHGRSDHVAALHAHFRGATADIAEALRESATVTRALGPGEHRIHARLKLALNPSEWPEFLRLVRALIDFLENVAQSRTATHARDHRCDHVLAIQLMPCETPLLPGPEIRVVGRGPAGPAARDDGLTPREREVAALAAVGVRRREIAGRLGISANTVATLLRRAYRKLRVSNREALAFRLGRGAAHGLPPVR
jgi:DNA-binding CsgD family transcriptional regulator